MLALEQIVGTHLDGRVLGPFVLGVDNLPAMARGVYVVLDTQGECAYVGKVCSELDANRLKARVASHLKDPVKREHFDCLYFFPVNRRAGNLQIEVFEGWFSRHLRPHVGKRSPRVRH